MKHILCDSKTTTDQIQQALQLGDDVVLEFPSGQRAIVTRLDDDNEDDEQYWNALESSSEFRESIARARQQKESISIEELSRKFGID